MVMQPNGISGNQPMVMQPNGISGNSMALQGQPSFSMVPAPPELGAKTGIQNGSLTLGTAVAYNTYTQ